MKKMNVKALPLLLAALALPMTGRAVNTSWNVGSGDWGTGANWDTTNVPTSSDLALINNGGVANITSNQNPNNIRVATGGGTSGTVNQTAGTLRSPMVTFILGMEAAPARTCFPEERSTKTDPTEICTSGFTAGTAP